LNYMVVVDSFNPDAGNKFSNDVDNWFLKMRECVELSVSELYNSKDEDCLKFAKLGMDKTGKIQPIQPILDKLKEVASNKELQTQDKIRLFLQNVLSTRFGVAKEE